MSRYTSPLPSQSLLIDLLDYDIDTGLLTWKYRGVEHFQPSATRTAEHIQSLWNVRYAGKPALNAVGKQGYRMGTLLGQRVKAHRIIIKLMTGIEPPEVDHINGNPNDNRWINLRAVSGAENRKNRNRQRNNKSGATGIWHNNSSWLAYISSGGRRIHLGSFASKEAAMSARDRALRVHGFSEGHGVRPPVTTSATLATV